MKSRKQDHDKETASRLYVLLSEEILQRAPESFDLEIKLFFPEHSKESTIVPRCSSCNRVMSRPYGKSVRYSCFQCGEYKLIALSEEITHDQKEYSTSSHCQAWLNRLQGKECVLIEDQHRTALIERAKSSCTVRGKFQPNLVPQIKCEEIRRWLRELQLTQFNKSIPALRRIITRELGREIIPPQFTAEEEKAILDEWLRVAEVYQKNYREMKNNEKSRSNNPYYPICIFFIVQKIFPNDIRATQLEEYIHKQAQKTMELRERCWRKTIFELDA